MPSFAFPEESNLIKIGATLHLTGDLAMPSAAFREGAELAVDQINQTGINGKKIKLIVEDGHNNARISNTAARKLVSTDRVTAAIISSYFDVMTSGPIFEENSIPVIALWDSSPEIENVGQYVFGIGPWTPSSGQLSANFAITNLQAKTAVIICNHDSWSEYVANAFEVEFKKQGGQILKRDSLSQDETDFKSLITKIRHLNPDVIYSPIVFNIPPFYKRLNELAVKAQIMTSDIITQENLLQNPEAFEGIYQTNLKDPENKIFKKIQGTYQAKFKKDLTLGWFVAIGYDGVMLLAEAIKVAGLDSKKITAAMYDIKNFPGASSEISINKKGSSPQYP
ncbi:MAG: ABC transporter substrate-binding protein, partial [Candidatus Paceibacterota bacterium]